MRLRARTLDLIKRYGEPVRFAVRLILGVLLPGSPAMVELVSQALDSAQKTSENHWDLDQMSWPALSPREEARVLAILDVVTGRLGLLIERVGPLAGRPELATALVRTTIENERGVLSALRSLVEPSDAVASWAGAPPAIAGGALALAAPAAVAPPPRLPRAPAAEGPRSPAIGDDLDGWRLEEVVGRGSNGILFRARKDGHLSGLLAIRPGAIADPAGREAFEAQVRTLCQLPPHPNLAAIRSFGCHEGRWYCVLDAIEGEPLSRRLEREGALAIGDARLLFAALADGLAACHRRGIAHGNVQPRHVLLAPDGTPVLTGVSLASARAGSRPPTRRATGFLAPERLLGAPPDPRSDVWSLAATLYHAVRYDDPDSRNPRAADDEDYPPELAAVLARSLARNPARRLAGAREFREALLEPLAIEGFRFLREESFECGGGRHRLPVYRCEAFAAALGLDGDRTDVACEFVRVPGGAFTMGSPREEEGPPHLVEVRPFLVARTPVVQAVWDGLARASGLPLADDRRWRGERLPMVGVSWDDLAPFLAACGLRLPSESEWEYACRAGTSTAYAFGDDPRDLPAHGWFEENSGARPRPVATLMPNAFGLHDVHGGVWEWCQDTWHEGYAGAPTDGSPRLAPGSPVRVLRGGGWNDLADRCRSADREWHLATRRFEDIGFRPVRG